MSETLEHTFNVEKTIVHQVNELKEVVQVLKSQVNILSSDMKYVKEDLTLLATGLDQLSFDLFENAPEQ